MDNPTFYSIEYACIQGLLENPQNLTNPHAWKCLSDLRDEENQ